MAGRRGQGGNRQACTNGCSGPARPEAATADGRAAAGGVAAGRTAAGRVADGPGIRTIDAQTERFHHEIAELVRKFQFRDRSEMTCCGVSVSQCYVLESLHRFGPQAMNELAKRQHLTVSTLTRLVDQLVAKGYADRTEDERDRRYRVIGLTKAGEAVFRKSWTGVFASEKSILEALPASERETLIRLLHKLNEAVEGWCCAGGAD